MGQPVTAILRSAWPSTIFCLCCSVGLQGWPKETVSFVSPSAETFQTLWSGSIGSWKRIPHVRSTAAPTAKTGLQGKFTASKMGLTKPKLEMSVPHKPQQPLQEGQPQLEGQPLLEGQ